jgi:hypothetical protein
LLSNCAQILLKLSPSLSHRTEDVTRPKAYVSSISKEDYDKEENFNISTPQLRNVSPAIIVIRLFIKGRGSEQQQFYFVLQQGSPVFLKVGLLKENFPYYLKKSATPNLSKSPLYKS